MSTGGKFNDFQVSTSHAKSMYCITFSQYRKKYLEKRSIIKIQSISKI